jgi:hypothetical protein
MMAIMLMMMMIRMGSTVKDERGVESHIEKEEIRERERLNH